MELSSTSGDVKGRLTPPLKYSYRASSRIGDVKVPLSAGKIPVSIQTVSGDITFTSR